MFKKRRTEVLVAGAGPVGLYTAAELTRRGIDVTVADAEWRRTGLSYALALHPDSVELLEEIGLAVAATQAGHRVEKIRFYEGTEPRFTLDYSVLETRHPYLTILPQNRLEKAMEDWLKERDVPVQWRHRVASLDPLDRPVKATLERWGEDTVGYAVARTHRVLEKSFPLEAAFVVGADGHHSVVRHQLPVEYVSAGEAEMFAVFEFETVKPPSHEAAVVLDEKTTNVLWPLPDGRCRWSFQLSDPDQFRGERIKSRLSELGHWVLPSLPPERLTAFLEERAPWFEGGVRDVIWSVAIRFERRLASSFGEGALWLAGDSAHLAGPVGVHSMNVGLKEGGDLARRMAAILREDASRSTLEEYGKEHHAEWERLLNLSKGLAATGDASDFVKKNAARILPAVPASGKNLEKLLAAIGLTLGS